jgi:hypothetical protein
MIIAEVAGDDAAAKAVVLKLADEAPGANISQGRAVFGFSGFALHASMGKWSFQRDGTYSAPHVPCAARLLPLASDHLQSFGAFP